MTAYLTTAACAVFVTIIVGFLIPEGKLNKSINFVMRTICIFVLVSPLLSLFNISGAQGNIDSVDYEYVCSVYSKTQSAEVEKKIKENLDVECDCLVEFVYEDGKIKENGVKVNCNFVEETTKQKICEYLKELGYINIYVNDENQGSVEK